MRVDGGTAVAKAATPRPQGGYRTPAAARDPFFDKPYEAPSAEAAPTWEAASRQQPARSGISANIKPKRKVAALFKAAMPAVETPSGQ